MVNSIFVIKDDKEITTIINQSEIKNLKNIIRINKDWKIITLDAKFPFNIVGVTARIASTLAKVNVSVLPIAAFSRDHFLVKEKDLCKTIEALKNIGLTLIEKK